VATETEQLVVSLEARINNFEKSFKRANRVANDNFRSIETRAKTSADRMERTMAGVGDRIGLGLRGIAAGAAAAFSTKAVVAAAKQYTNLQNALKVTGLEGTDLVSTFNSLFQIAQKNGTAIGPLVSLYARASQAQKELKASSSDVIKFTDGVSLALRVAGTSSEAASGALLQLGQLLGSGVVHAEEFNSVNEGARPILQAVAAGMKEAGNSVATLKTLVNDGKVSSEAFFAAFMRGMPQLESQAAKASGTIDQASSRIQNALVALVGHLDDVSGASKTAAGNLDGVAVVIQNMPAYIDAAVGGLGTLQAKLTQLGNSPFFRRLGEMFGVDYSDAAVRAAGLKPMGDVAAKRVGGAFAALGNKPAAPAAAAAINPISLKDYKVPGAKASKGGSGEKSDEDKRSDQVDAYLAQLEKTGRVLQAQFETLGKSNAERAKAVDLARIGTVTDADQLAKITAQVDANEQLRQKIESVEKAQRSAKEAAAEFADVMSDGLADAIVDGKDLTSVLADVAKTLERDVLKGMLTGGGSFGGLFGGGGKNGAPGGLFGLIASGLGSMLADGGPVRGPGTSTSDSIPAMLSDGEFVVNAEAARKHAALLHAINAGTIPRYAAGGVVGRSPSFAAAGAAPITINAPITVNAAGGTPAQNRDLAAQTSKAIEATMRQVITDELRVQLRQGGMLRR
jgi:tape measure domain-containing protein